MSEDNKTCLIIGLSLTLIVLIVAVANVWYYSDLNRSAMENGYEQRTIPGQDGVYWIKSAKAELE